MYGSWTKNVVDNFSESFETYSEVFTVHICSTREQIQSDSKKFVVSILLETPGGILFSLEGLQKMPFTIQNFTHGDLHYTGGIQMSFLGGYNSTGGILLSFLGVYNSTGGIPMSFLGIYNSTGGIQLSFLGGYNSTGGIQLSFLGVYNSTGGIQISFLGV